MQHGGLIMMQHQRDGHQLQLTATMDAPTLIQEITQLRNQMKIAVLNLEIKTRRLNELPDHLRMWKAKSDSLIKELKDAETLPLQERRSKLDFLKIYQAGMYNDFSQLLKIENVELPSRIQEILDLYAQNERILKIVLQAVLPRLSAH